LKLNVLGVKIPEHKNLVKYSHPAAKTFKSDPQVEWIPPIASDTSDDHKRNEKINKYFEDLGEDAIPFKNSEAALKRKEQAQKQIPPHDFKPEKCDNLTEFETQQLKKYVDSVKKNFLGQGEIDIIERTSPTLSRAAGAASTNPFRHQSTDLNALNNNVFVNDMLNNLSLNKETNKLKLSWM
jgi:hypothetical protein